MFSRLCDKNSACPACGSKETVPIVFGYPTDETFEAHGRGEVALGGWGYTLLSRTFSKRPIMAMDERHAKKKNVLGGVQT